MTDADDAPLFGDLGEGEMFRHVDAGRVVVGVMRKELSMGECPGNAVVVATGERWLFPGRARVERTRALAVLLGLPTRAWPGKRQDCAECAVRRECVELVRSFDMTICEAVVEMRGPVKAEDAATQAQEWLRSADETVRS